MSRAVFYEQPLLKFKRLLATYAAFAPRGYASFETAIPLWLRQKVFQRSRVRELLRQHDQGTGAMPPLEFCQHDHSHAASAFYPSPFDTAAIVTMDGVGEWTTTSVSWGQGKRIELLREIRFPHSLGLLYSAFTSYLGFKVNSGEYKVMGLAPYGEPRQMDLLLDCLIDLKKDGSFRLNLEYFDYCTGLSMINARFEQLMGSPARKPDEPLEQRHMDLAASIQAVTEEAVLRIAREAAAETGSRNLCLAGGVALNCVANGRLVRSGHFDRVWVQPASGDAGGALGAALVGWHRYSGAPRAVSSGDAMKGAFLGPGFSQIEIERRLRELGAKFEVLSECEMLERSVDALESGCVVGWFQGRMEFGPRALGARSILADPRSSAMQRQVNLKVKYRESFRPFAPSVLREDLKSWFELDCDSPYMLLVADVAGQRRCALRKEHAQASGFDRLKIVRSQIPAVTHVDYSARIQTVHRETNPLYYSLIERFKARTGCPVLLNTSFNVRGEPIVCSVEDAFRCFMGSGIDALAIGNSFLRKQDQDSRLADPYDATLPLD